VSVLWDATEYFTHETDQLQCALVAHAIEHPIGILAGQQHALVPENRQVLGNVALGGADRFDDVLNAHLIVTKHAQDLQPERVGNGLQCPRRGFDMFFLVDQVEDGGCVHDGGRVQCAGANIIKYQFSPPDADDLGAIPAVSSPDWNYACVTSWWLPVKASAAA